ncbi:MAG: prephenate dehydrogenase [Methanobacteriaceae archaeon]|jgi:prephenate dehydrogenase|uniref:prephenate dehydrogenase n=1 Tax=Methanobrevibacter TaxID=2172 RepID=UPI003766A076|nr:prephenate dehydrogenase [Methanobacteriaceae archaeon]MDD4593740.1 prephenate dehydrogenase [Methanobacteriaceae archaeon]
MKIGIIGGTRGLGKTLAWFFKRENFDVTITGRDETVGKITSYELNVNYSSNNEEVVKSSDIIIISVPISSTKDVIKELAPKMTPGSLLIDVTSVKEGPSKIMEKYVPKDVEFIPTHPVFGPRTTSLNGQIIVLTPKKKGKWYPKVKKFLKNKKMKVIETVPQEHDKMMAIVQVLTHFSYISTAYAIAKLNVNVKDTQDFESPIYNLMIDMIARIVSQNPFLTYSIQLENKNGELVRQTFADAVCELKDVISTKDEDKFVDIALIATKNMGDIQSALGRSDKAINSLNHESNILKMSIGKEIGLKHIYSGIVHIGILEDLGPEFLKLNTNKHHKKLKISNVEVLSEKELIQWKIKLQKNYSQSISCVFPLTADQYVIKDTINNIKDITNVKIIDVYTGPQIQEGFTSFTFKIEALNNAAFESTKNILKGFGGVIR